MSNLAKTSTLTTGVLGLLSLSTVLFAAPSQAAVVNGSFEQGLFGWESRGSVGAIDDSLGVNPRDGYFQAGLTTYASRPAASLENFLGLSNGSLSSLGNGVARGGAAIKQTFTANVGDVISFDWNFLTDEGTPNARNNDFAFFSLSGLTELADTNVSFVDSFSPFREETGYQTTSYTITKAGTYTLGLGVVNTGDVKGLSGLLVDNVRTETVPEPASMLGILAFGALGGKKLLKRKQKTAE